MNDHPNFPTERNQYIFQQIGGWRRIVTSQYFIHCHYQFENPSPSQLYQLNLLLYIDSTNALHPLESHLLFANIFTQSFIFRQLVGLACTSACFQCLSIHCSLILSVRMFPSSDNLDSCIVSFVDSKIKAKFIWLHDQEGSFLIILAWGDHPSVQPCQGIPENHITSIVCEIGETVNHCASICGHRD